MRVLQVNTTDRGGGGAQAIAVALADALAARGHDTHMAVGVKRTNRPDVSEIPDAALRRPLARAAARAARRLGDERAGLALELAASPRRAAAVARGLEDFDHPGTQALLDLPPWRPDVVHLHNLHGGYFDLRALPALSAAVPVVVTLHDEWLMTGHCAYTIEGDRWRRGCQRCPDLRRYPAILRDAAAANWRRKRDIHAASRLHVAGPAAWVVDRARVSMLGPGAASFTVIPNGVDLDVFTPGDRAAARARLGLPLDRRIVLTVGSAGHDNPYKDPDTVHATAARLGKTHDALLAWLGATGDNETLGGVDVRRTGAVAPGVAMADWYVAADVCLHAARADTFPTSVLEALACGTPVVATDVGGVAEQVDNGTTGLLAQAGDTDSLAAHLRTLLDDPARRDGMAAAAAGVARERFDAARMVDGYLGLYAATRAASRMPAS